MWAESDRAWCVLVCVCMCVCMCVCVCVCACVRVREREEYRTLVGNRRKHTAEEDRHIFHVHHAAEHLDAVVEVKGNLSEVVGGWAGGFGPRGR